MLGIQQPASFTYLRVLGNWWLYRIGISCVYGTLLSQYASDRRNFTFEGGYDDDLRHLRGRVLKGVGHFFTRLLLGANFKWFKFFW